MQLFEEFALAYLQFLTEEAERVVHRLAQHVAHAEEVGFVVVDDAAVGRDADLAVGEGVERVDGLVRRYARGQMYENLHLGGRVVIDLANLYLALLGSLQYGVDERRGGLAIGNLGDGQRLVVHFVDTGTHAHRTAAFTVVVAGHVDETARLEVGVEHEVLTLEVAHGGIAQLVEVVGENLRRQTYGNTLDALCQQEGELHG